MAIVTTAADTRELGGSHYTVSWGAVFAGLLLALMVYLVLTVLGTAIGASSIDPLTERNPFSGFGVGAGIWAAVTTLIALATGGFIAGYLARRSGVLHGLLAWALTTLITLYMLMSAAGSMIGAASSAAQAGLSAVGSVAGAAAPAAADAVKERLQQAGVPVSIDGLVKEVEQGAGADASDLKAAAGDIRAWFERIRARPDNTITPADKQELANIIATRTGKSPAEAQQIVDRYEQTYNQATATVQETKAEAVQTARQVGDTAATNVARGSWGTLAVLLIGAAVAAGAGGVGFRSQQRRAGAAGVAH